MKEKLFSLIPAYQPTEILTGLVSELSEYGFHIIVVDDGSGEQYQPIFEAVKPLATVLSYPDNHGKGYALKYGLSYIENMGITGIVVTMDSDGQHTVADALRVAESVCEKPDSVILGVRTFKKEVPFRSRFGNAITRSVYRICSGCSVSDTQTGLRGFHTSLLPFMVSIDGDRYEYEMNVLSACPKQNIPFYEVPIATIYENNNKGSHFHAVRDSFLIYKNLLKFAASSFIGFLTDYGLYSLMVLLTAGLGGAVSIPLSNITARVVSAGVNFAINKHFVFGNRDSIMKTGIQYFLLASCILAGNTVLLSFLVNTLELNKFGAKLITEITFFTFSWLVQRFIIFKKGKK